MNKLSPITAVALIFLAATAFSADQTQLGGKPIDYLTQDGRLLLHAEQAAAAMDWKAKHIPASDGSSKRAGMLIICRDEASGVCIPLRLDRTPSKIVDGNLYIEAESLGSAIGFSVGEANKRPRLTAHELPRKRDDEPPAYNAAWGKGRGFGLGDTLPDIPLYDMDGGEVRFGKFLGKKYILYCWASW